MSLLQLPNELILSIAEYLEPLQLKYLYSFLQTSKRFAYLLLPLLDRFATNEKYIVNALCWSAAIKNEDRVRYLIDHGGDTVIVTDTAEDIESINLPQLERKKKALVGHVLAQGPNLTVASSNTGSLKQHLPILHLALLMNYNSLSKLLLERGADATTSNHEGITPLHLAAIHGDESILRLLLKTGAATMCLDAQGKTPISLLMDSCTLVPRKSSEPPPPNEEKSKDSLEILKVKLSKIRLMLEHGDIGYRDQFGNTGLHRAAAFGDEALAKVLLQRGIKVNARGIKERTAIHLAVMSGSSTLVMDMVETYGANVMSQDRYGNTPLHLAIQYKRKVLIRLLIEMSTDIEIADRCGRTALHWAAGMGDIDTVRLLWSKGVSHTVRDNDERTPLFLAAELGHVSVVKILVDGGADIDTQDKYGNTISELVKNQVLRHPERCLPGSPSISLGKWPRREQYWGVWHNILENVSKQGSHKVLCNPGQHTFKFHISHLLW